MKFSAYWEPEFVYNLIVVDNTQNEIVCMLILRGIKFSICV